MTTRIPGNRIMRTVVLAWFQHRWASTYASDLTPSYFSSKIHAGSVHPTFGNAQLAVRLELPGPKKISAVLQRLGILLFGSQLIEFSTLTMGMWMVQDVLAPRMQHAHETDICTQVLGVGSDLQ